jgi:glutathione S-transferase
MYKLHYFPGNASAVPHMLLEESGVDYELCLVDRDINAQKSPEYMRINPMGRIPTLEDGTFAIFETAAIVLHLLERHPEGLMQPLAGTGERSKFYQWLFFLTNSLQEELMIWQYPDRLVGADAVSAAMVRQGAEARASTMLDVIEKHLSSNGLFFLGAKISAVDFYLLVLARWARPMSNPPRTRPAISKLLAEVSARPAVQRAYAAEGITDGIY